FFFSSRRRHTRCYRHWSTDVSSSDLGAKSAIFPRTTHTYAVPRRASHVPTSKRDRTTPPPTTRATAYAARREKRPRTIRASGLRSEERRIGKEWRARVGT